MECFLCQSKKPPLIKSARISSFREASRQRDDGLNEKLEDDAEYILCHRTCMGSYCSKDHLQRLLKKRKKTDGQSEEEPKRLRGRSSTFNFREHCLFCGDMCLLEPPKKHPGRWKKAYICRTGDEKGRKTTKDEILKRGKERGDKWGTEVCFRLSSAVSDLHAADARYHRDCYSRFYSNNPSECTSSATTQDYALQMLVDEMLLNKARM